MLYRKFIYLCFVKKQLITMVLLDLVKQEWLKGIQHMAIAKRITLLYGGIFSLSLLFISGFMMLNISDLQQSEMRRELQETMTQVQEFLQTSVVQN